MDGGWITPLGPHLSILMSVMNVLWVRHESHAHHRSEDGLNMGERDVVSH